MDHDRKIRVAAETKSDADKASDFARELTEITHKHGVGITGEPVLFMLEKDDASLSYDVDGESHLTLV